MNRRLAITVVIGLAVAGAASFALAEFTFGPAHHRVAQSPATYHHLKVINIASRSVGGSRPNGQAIAQAHFGMLMSQATDLGTVGSGSAAVHLISVPTSKGGSCLVATTTDGGAGGSCLGTPSLFTDRPVAFIEESDGGPAPANINYLRIVGVVQPGVTAVQVQLASGTTEAVSLSSTGAFDYEEALSTIHAGDLPSALVVDRGAGAPTVVTIPSNQ